jgi:RHS repeat-associated protein
MDPWIVIGADWDLADQANYRTYDGAAAHRFTYDQPGRLLTEAESGTNGAVVEYVWLAGLPLAMLLDADGSGAGAAAAYTLGMDHLGTPHRAWDDSAEFAWAADYEAFGKAWEYLPNSTAAPAVEVNLRFPGQYLDRETGLHYNWHRYYDSNTGRYLTPDPLGLGGGDPTLFAYAAGSPLRFLDPHGLKVLKCRRRAQQEQLNKMDKDHMWLQTDTVQAGMGPSGGSASWCGLPSYPVEITDHSWALRQEEKDKIQCSEVRNVDESCVNRELEIGKALGVWSPFNNCATFVTQVLELCKVCRNSGRYDPTYAPFLSY